MESGKPTPEAPGRRAAGPPGGRDALVDSLPFGLLAVDAGGRVVRWNRTFERAVAPAERVLGKPLAEALALLADPLRTEDLRALILEGAAGRGEASSVEAYPLRTLDGASRVFDVRIVPWTGPAGERLGAAAVWEDVTDRRRKEVEALRSARIQSLAGFGGAIAHEVRNPLNSIALNLQLLRDDVRGLPGDEKQGLLEGTGAVLEEIERLNRVVGDLLRFAKNPSPTLAEGDAAEAVHRALKLLSGEARRASVRVERSLVPLPGVRIDEDLLGQAVYNVALNGIQAMRGGGILRVRTEAAPHAAVIEIADTGPGVTPEDRDRIFDLFYSRRSGGTGLGLPITLRIVEGHRGRITVGASPDGGALFQIHLPWARGDAGEPPPPGGEGTGDERAENEEGGRRKADGGRGNGEGGIGKGE
ncbi:MAG: ATP-binding protein [Planctomycetes bacterium]|nr:ATP-binding protein [Planctomycetota bacterium]